MVRIILTTLCLTVLFISLLGASLIIGHAQPPDSRLTALHFTDCTPPCWIGILPDHTTWGEAEALFSLSYPDHEPFLIVANDTGGGVKLRTLQNVIDSFATVPQIFISDFTASERMIANSRLMPRLGDLLLLWGLPTCIFADASTLWVLRYQHGSDRSFVLDVKVLGHRFSPHQAVYYVDFHLMSPRGADGCPAPRRPWFGFATLP